MSRKSPTRFQKLRATGERIWEGVPVEKGAELPRWEKFGHFWVVVGRDFVRNRCPLRASALSYSTLLALIPILAVAVSVTSIFLKQEGEEQIYRFIDGMVAGVMPPATISTNEPAGITNPPPVEAVSGPAATNAPASTAVTNASLIASANASAANTPTVGSGEVRIVQAQKRAAQYIHGFIQNIRGGTLGVTGMVLLIFVAIAMFSRIEDTFNDIWDVPHGRHWFMRVLIYWTVPTLGTVLVAGALVLASGPYFATSQRIIGRMPFVGGLVFQCLPVVVLWLTFTLVYQLLPNTRVHFSAALVGGFVGGLLWHLNNVFGFLYISRVATNMNIYGGLGLVPVFMAGVYLSWLILLFGAQVAQAFQNRAKLFQAKFAGNVNQRGREFIAFRLMTCIGQRFQRGLAPATVPEIASELAIPGQLVQQVLQTLLAARLVVEIARAEPAYAPARPLETITAHHVLMAMRAGVGKELLAHHEPVSDEVYGEFARIQAAERQAAASITLLDLVNRAQARLQLAPPSSAEKETAFAQPTESAPDSTKPVPAATEAAEPAPSPADESSGSAAPMSVSNPSKTTDPTTGPEDRSFPL